MNQPLSKEEYEKKVSEFLGSYESMERAKAEAEKLQAQMVRKYANIVNSENSSGDYIEHSRNCLDCYDVNDSEDCRYVTVGVNVKDNYDCSNMYIKSELCYELLGTIGVNMSAYSLYVFHSQRLLYCDYCFNCSDCFACSGLTRKQYCIFNKQYSKEEYEELVPRIIEHMKKTREWGQFFPPELSSFGYNESVANEYFPLSREEALAQGFLWREQDAKGFQTQNLVLKDKISDEPTTLSQEILQCKNCDKNYRITPQEFKFYKEQNIPAPRKCPDCRYDARLKARSARRLWDRNCDQCGISISSPFAPTRPEKVFCEECYLKTVY